MGKDINLEITGDPSGLAAALEEAKTVVAEKAAEMREALLAVNEAFTMIGEAGLALTAILAGGKAFGEFVNGTKELNVEAMQLGKQFGISASQASVLNVALDESFVTQDQFSAAGQRLLKTLNTNEGAFKDIGVATRDASGHLRPLADLVLDTNEALLKFKEGSDRDTEAIRVYGRGAQELSATFRLTREAIDEAKITAEQLNLVVSVESEAATKAYRQSIVGVGDVMRGIGNVIGQAMMPALTSLANWFRSIGPAAIDFTRVAVATFGEGFIEFRREVANLYDYVAGNFKALGTQIAFTAHAIVDALHFNWAAVKSDFASGLDDERAIYQAYLANVAKNNADAAEAVKTLNKSVFGPQTETAPPAPGQTSSGTSGAGEKLANEQLALIEKMFRADSDYIDKLTKTQEEAYREQEAAFSKAAGARIAIAEQEVALEAAAYGKESPQYEAAQRHLIETKRKATEELQQMGAAFDKADTDRQLAAIATQEQALNAQFKAGEITNKQLEAELIELENRKTAIAEAGIKAREALLDPQTDPVAFAQLAAQMEALEQQHATRITQIREQAAQRDKKIWDQLNNSLQKDFAQSLSKMLEGTQSFSGGMRTLFQSLSRDIIESFAQTAVKNIATMVEQAVVGKSIRAQEIQGDAGAAAAATYKSIAAIPYVGPFLAPAAAAVAYGAVLAFDSAEGGYDIPRGVNPRVQLHENEMVLPAPISKGLRNLIAANDGGGSRGGGGGSGITMNVSTTDAKSLERQLKRNGTLTKALKDAHRRGSRG